MTYKKELRSYLELFNGQKKFINKLVFTPLDYMDSTTKVININNKRFLYTHKRD